MSLQSTDQDGGFDAGSDSLGDRFYPLFERLFADDSNFVADVETKLAQSRMTDTVEMYLSRALAIGVLAGGILWLFGMLIGYAIFVLFIDGGQTLTGIGITNQTLIEFINLIKVPVLVLTTGIFLGTIGFAMGFGALVAVPYSRASSRKREINMLLTDGVSFMYALSVGGLNQLEILEAMAAAEDTYGEVAKEFQSIVQETEYFDTDYRTAIRNQAMETPSDELAQFLTDMLSIVNSGGDMEGFLYDKKEKHMRTAKQEQELKLETLELFGEMYMTLSLFPLLLIIILVIMQMLGEANVMMLYGTVYGMIPLTGLGFLVLVSTVKQDEPGDGYLLPDDADERLTMEQDSGVLNLGLIEQYSGHGSMFDRIKNKEGTYETVQILKQPHLFFKENPAYTMALTVPIALVAIIAAALTGSVPTSWQAMQDGSVVWGTFVYVYLPVYLIFLPFAVFREWNVRSRQAIVSNISDNLRKLSSANDTGLTLLESFKTVSDTTSGKMATEFDTMHAKVNYGMSLKDSLVEFNNKYHMPRMARTVKLISKAQEASSQITDVLSTAAQASENQDDIERERKSRTRMQVVIIIMTYLTLLAVMAILKTQFLDTLESVTASSSGGGGASAGGGGGALGGSVNVPLLSMLFFHAVTMQAILSGFIAGYIRDADITSGLKFVLVLMTISLFVWAAVQGAA